MKKLKIKWLDPVTQGMLILLIGIILFLILFLMKKVFLGTVLLCASTLRLGWAAKKEPGLILENEYPHDFFIQSPKNPDAPTINVGVQILTPSVSIPIYSIGTVSVCTSVGINQLINPVKIQPHSNLPIPAQLIYINNKIFKVYHGTHIKITKDGHIITYSPISRLLNEYIDSKKLNKNEKEWLNKIFQST